MLIMKSTRLFVQTLSAVLLLFLVTGCTHLVKIKVQPATLPVVSKLPVHAALVMDGGLTNFVYDYHLQGDIFRYQFGPPLRDYARHLTGASFAQVDEVSSKAAALADTSADIVLIPRGVKADQGVGVWAWDKVNFTMVIEWTAIDRTSQNTIWLKTITADASEAEGNAFTATHDRNVLMQKLFNDLSAKTLDAFQKAPELHGQTTTQK